MFEAGELMAQVLWEDSLASSKQYRVRIKYGNSSGTISAKQWVCVAVSTLEVCAKSSIYCITVCLVSAPFLSYSNFCRLQTIDGDLSVLQTLVQGSNRCCTTPSTISDDRMQAKSEMHALLPSGLNVAVEHSSKPPWLPLRFLKLSTVSWMSATTLT